MPVGLGDWPGWCCSRQDYSVVLEQSAVLKCRVLGEVGSYLSSSTACEIRLMYHANARPQV